jgi:hypothetical protein
MKKKLIILLSVIMFFSAVQYCFAASLVDDLSCAKTVTSSGTATSYNCSLNDFVRIGTNAANIIFGLVGSLALLFFVYGGIMWLLSGGNPERVKKGTEIIKNAVIGIVIVFTSYMIINFILTTVGYKYKDSWNTTKTLDSSSSSTD